MMMKHADVWCVPLVVETAVVSRCKGVVKAFHLFFVDCTFSTLLN